MAKHGTGDEFALATIRHLENIARNIVTAINVRDLQQTSPAWQDFAQHFRADPDCPWRRHTRIKGREGVTLEEWLSMARDFATRNPSHQINVLGLTTRFESSRQARVFVTTNGQDDSDKEFAVVHVAMLSFVLDERHGKWLCVRQCEMRGFG